MTEKITNTQKAINRREMLKKGALAAGGAITAAAFMDGKWLKPVVKTGVLPVHAQASMCEAYTFTPSFLVTKILTIYNLAVAVVPFGPGGTITYEIITWNECTISGAISGTGNVDETTGLASFPGEIKIENANENTTVTILWTYDGCEYIQTYGEDDRPEQPEPLQP